MKKVLKNIGKIVTGVSLFSGLVFNSCNYEAPVKQESYRDSIVQRVDSLNGVGIELRYQSPKVSLLAFGEARREANKVNYKKGIIDSYLREGFVYRERSNLDGAEKNWKKALKLSEEIGDSVKLAICYNNLGNAVSDRNNNKKALEYYLKSVDISERIGALVNLSRTYNNIGTIFSGEGDIESAMRYYRKDSAIVEKILKKDSLNSKVNSNFAIVLKNMGVMAERKKDKKFVRYYFGALKYAKKAGDEFNIASSYSKISKYYSDRGRYDSARYYVNKSIGLFKKNDNMKYLARNLQWLAEIEERQGNFDGALKNLNKSLEIGKNSEDLFLFRNVYYGFKAVYEKRGEYKKAMHYFNLYFSVYDSLYNIKSSGQIAEMETRYRTEKKEQENKLLHKESELQQTKLDNQKKVLWTGGGAFALILLLSLGLYRSYRSKKRANALLVAQKQEISEKNEELNQQNEEIRVQRDEIEQQKNRIETIHKEVSQSIDYAKRIQTSILPDGAILQKYLQDYFVFYKPKDVVSGDFYWAAHVENHTIITVADCTGHGVPGAFMSMLGTSFLREIVQKEYITHTGVILRRLRKEIIKALKQTGEEGEQKDGMDMSLISINHETGEVQFSGANNPLYLITNYKLQITNYKSRITNDESRITNTDSTAVKLFDNSESKIQNSKLLYEVKPDKMPIAIYERMDKFATHEIRIQKGDQLYLFSDGFADQFGGPKGKKFKYKPFKQLIMDNCELTMQEQKGILEKSFEDWKGNLEQIDDITVVGVKI